ncbi:DUF3014 domain-containing protein [Coralloluteibacterium stylophorae]|uniref:DUF3014 domain-containing protein n=1 Tax=Coralloluteibacterium stylophorae TaxID=1776034 RepID=A0A8J7VSZ8_9GAMM|nr:DUF3014 domain-containing protein [Coralloluteibacterium stylophorae]MBS7457965.1 DUF3014 domain-containing protein [Coralloluteibacterium stylophorae]
MRRKKRATGWIWILLLLLAAGAGWWIYTHHLRPAAESAATAPAGRAREIEVPATPAPRHPIEEVATAEAPADEAVLPALGESDAAVRDALGGLVPAELLDLLVPQHLISRFVATVDGLTSERLTPQALPVKRVGGTLALRTAEDGRLFLAEDNARRYAPYVQALTTADTGLLVGTYTRMYPLFQRAWRELGYPDRYFNDRLVEVIDHLLATPPVPAEIELVRGRVGYAYADPAYESWSVGRKALLRMGPEQAQAVKAKLRDIRARLVGEGAPVAGPAAAAAEDGAGPG